MIKQVKIGNVLIGGTNPIAVQSMTTTHTRDTAATIFQINQLVDAGCDIVRVAIVDEADTFSLNKIVKVVNIPIVADIHFDYRLAVLSILNGAAKVRVNPGNLGDISNFVKVIECAKANQCVIRIGVNSGSVNADSLKKCNGNINDALIDSLMEYVKICEQHNFTDIVLSAKASKVIDTININTKLAGLTDYPLHIGVTEAGTIKNGVIKSSIGIGALLAKGIGSTIRVSLTDDPIREVEVALSILSSLNLRNHIDVVSCPTCGRCNYKLFDLVEKVEHLVGNVNKSLKIAVMGCVVNGPGEAADADLGIAGGDGKAVIFSRGKIFKTVDITNAEEEFMFQLNALL